MQYILPKRRIIQPLHGAETLKNTAVWYRYGSTHTLVTVAQPQAKNSSHNCKHDVTYPSKNCSARNCTAIAHLFMWAHVISGPQNKELRSSSHKMCCRPAISSSQLSRMKTLTFSNRLIQLRHSLIQAHCQVAHTTCFGPTLMTCCAYSWVSIVFLEI